MKTRLPLLVCALLVLAACAPQPTTAPIVPRQPSATSIPPPTPTSTPDPYACLRGDWLLNPEQTAQLLTYLPSQPSLTILEGGLRIQFDRGSDTSRFDVGAFAYHSDDLFLRTSFLEGFLDARARILIEGTYATTGEQIQFTKTGAQNELYDWRAVDSQGNIQPFNTTSPVFNFDIAKSATYTCNDDSLTLVFDEEDLTGPTFNLERIKPGN